MRRNATGWLRIYSVEPAGSSPKLVYFLFFLFLTLETKHISSLSVYVQICCGTGTQ